jgi:hypothetical protein
MFLNQKKGKEGTTQLSCLYQPNGPLLGVSRLGHSHRFGFIEFKRGQSQFLFALLVEALQLLVVAFLHVGVFAKYAGHSDSFLVFR